MIDNEPGTLQMVNGQLTCVASRRSDAQPTYDHAEGTRRKAEARAAMMRDQAEAWRQKD